MANDTAHPSVGTLAEIWALEAGSVGDTMTPELFWQCEVTAEDLGGPAAAQRTTITIGSAGFATGRLVVTIPRPGTTAVVVSADASVTDDEEDLADTTATAIDALIATTLAGVVLSAVDDGNTVVIDLAPGIGSIDITAVYTPAQQTTVTWGGALVDGEYSVTINTIEIPNNRTAGSPANTTNMADAFEVSAEAAIAGDLADTLVSADNVGAVNTLIFEPGLVAMEVTAEVTANCVLTFGGTETDGTYLTLFENASLPGGRLELPVERAAGSPATNTDLADEFEAEAEAGIYAPLLTQLLMNANNTAGANLLTFFPGLTASSMLVTALSAPAPGTLTITRPSITIEDATPAGPEITVSHEIYVDLNALQPNDAFPGNVLRMENPMLRVTEEFPAGTTATLDDAGNAGTDVIDGAAVDATGWVSDIGSSVGDDAKTELDWEPRLTLALSDASPATGVLRVQVVFSPLPE